MKMIFHMPEDFLSGNDKGPNVRPRRFLSAFKKLGYDVFLVAGTIEKRLRQYKILKQRLFDGEIYDFIYSESSSYPTLWTETKKTFFGPKVDYKLFKLMKHHNIPMGVYLRDIYWVSSQFKKESSFLKRLIYTFMHELDLYYYKKYSNILYLQSLRMANFLPHQNWFNIKSLPPGIETNKREPSLEMQKTSKLRLFYVGGINSHYNMDVVYNVLKKRNDVELTLCCRKEDLALWGDPSKGLSNVNIIHKNSSELAPYILNSDVALLYFEPGEYRSFVMPNKMYEYIAYLKPIISNSDTVAGDFLTEKKLGWAIGYTEKCFGDLLDFIISKPSCLSEIRNNAKTSVENEDWLIRAKQVVGDLK